MARKDYTTLVDAAHAPKASRKTKLHGAGLTRAKLLVMRAGQMMVLKMRPGEEPRKSSYRSTVARANKETGGVFRTSVIDDKTVHIWRLHSD